MSRRTRILMAALALFVFLGAVMSGYLNSDATPRQKYQISVIVYGNNRDRWAFLREGLNQGASELPVELSFSAMAQEADPQEQIRVVNQEIRNGAQKPDRQGRPPAVEHDRIEITPQRIRPEIKFRAGRHITGIQVKPGRIMVGKHRCKNTAQHDQQ